MNCVRGCTIPGLHKPGCTCTPECEEHKPHCTGCLPATVYVGRLCEHDINRIHRDIRDIPELVIAAISRRDGKLSPGRKGETDTSRQGTRTPQSPSRAWDTGEETMQWALRMALTYADSHATAGPFRYRRDGVPIITNVTNLLTYVANHLAWYAEEIPKDIYDEVVTTHRALLYLTGQDELVHRIKDHRCPTCNQITLVREDGSDRVICRNRDCARIWTEDEFDWFAHVAAS